MSGAPACRGTSKAGQEPFRGLLIGEAARKADLRPPLSAIVAAERHDLGDRASVAKTWRMRPELNPLTQIAAALVKRLSASEAQELRTAQVRLTGVVAGLWRCYGELAAVVGMLPSDTPRAVELPAQLDAFAPGKAVRIAGSTAQTDSRIALRDQLSLEQMELLIEQLTETVLHAPVLASREILLLLRELEPAVVDRLASLLDDSGPDTDVILLRP